MLKISLVIPVYNRPGEVEELLQSLSLQSDKDFEVIIVEDGSSESSLKVVESYSDRLDIKYYFKANSGPGPSRNFGCKEAKGDYLVFLDSDCVVPPAYCSIVKERLNSDYVDAFGGPDRAHADFTKFQKAINFSMTSFLTTGGIRGGNEKMGKFHPRSFNMGFSRKVFEVTGGFSQHAIWRRCGPEPENPGKWIQHSPDQGCICLPQAKVQPASVFQAGL